MAACAAWLVKIVVFRFVPTTKSMSSAVIMPGMPCCQSPAALTRTSSPPSADTAASIMALTADESLASHCNHVASAASSGSVW